MKKHLKRLVSLAMAACMMASLATVASAKTITLKPSGYQLEVSDYATEQSANSSASGGNYNLFRYDDFTDLAGGHYDKLKDAVNWWLSCGVTNGGESWTYFGAESNFYRYDLAFFLYRFYGITNDDGLWPYADFPHNPLSGTHFYKFTDAVLACRWAGIMNGIGNDCFDPYGSLTTEELLTVLYRVVNWSPEILPQATRDKIAEFGQSDYHKTTTQINANFPASVTAKIGKVDVEGTLKNLNYFPDGSVSEWAKEAVAFFIATGLYTPPANFNPQDELNKIEVINILYQVCKGTGAPQTDKFGLFGSTTVMNDYTKDTTVKGGSFTIGNPDEPVKGTSLIAVRNGAKVTMEGVSITSNGVEAGSGYQLAYRWGDSPTVIAYGKGSVLTLKDATLDFAQTVERNHGGLMPTAGGTIIVDNATFKSHLSSISTYNGTLVYKNTKGMTTKGSQTGRTHSSDFFSGVTVYENCELNKGMTDDNGKPLSGIAFNDEAASLYILNCPYYGAGFGNLTGVATAYVENSTLYATPTNCTNNTSMLSDVTSYRMVNSTVTYPAGIATVVKEGRLAADYINCGEIKLEGDLGDFSLSDYSEYDGYDIVVLNSEFGSHSTMRLRLDGTTFSRPLNVYVAKGCDLIVEVAPGTKLPTINQDTSKTMDILSYVDQKNPDIGYKAVPNCGTVTIQQLDWNK
jgi:hypothetical protein